MTQTPHVEMAVAINLNDQQPPGAVKIRNVWAYTLLTAKLDSELPSPKRLPQSPFRLCWIVSLFTPFIQRGLAVENTNWLLVHDSIPPTMTPVSITTTHPLPASPFKRGRSLSGPFLSPVRFSLKEPGRSRKQKSPHLGVRACAVSGASGPWWRLTYCRCRNCGWRRSACDGRWWHGRAAPCPASPCGA